MHVYFGWEHSQGNQNSFYLFVVCNPLTVVVTSFSEVILQKAGREQCLLECLLGQQIDRKITHCLQPLHLPCIILNDCFFLLKYFLRSNRHFPRIFTHCFCNDRGTWACHCGAEAFRRCTGKGSFSEVVLLICYLSCVLSFLFNKQISICWAVLKSSSCLYK